MFGGTTIKDSGFSDWTPERLGDQTGKTFVITGGNSGIGLEAAKILASKGGAIVIACRNPAKATAAMAQIRAKGSGKVDSITLDLADLASARACADELAKKYPAIDALINNAGIMQTPKQATADGFELQLGTNHLGHFLLTALLLPQVEAAGGRIVVVASIAHKFGKIHFDDLMLERRYDPSIAYAQSKLANLMFALELDRRLRKKASPAAAIACHPGYSNTNLQSTGPTGIMKLIYAPMNAIFAQPARLGAYPTVLAAAEPRAQAGGYYGPTGPFDARGPVSDAKVTAKALKQSDAARLWQMSEKLTGVKWP